MRVHGEIEIKRRIYGKTISPRSARTMLEADFRGLCGYCGKNGKKLRQRFHVDHFVPQKIDKGRKSDYTNFVWACPKCNVCKSDKWPTEDKTIAHTDMLGFVDPASPEFDEHLFRDESGFIVGRTPLGEQMCQLLNFHLRKTDLFWKLSRLYDMKEDLQQKFRKQTLSVEEHEYYIDLDMVLDTILDSLYEEGE